MRLRKLLKRFRERAKRGEPIVPTKYGSRHLVARITLDGGNKDD